MYITAVTLFPFILVRSELMSDEVLINHEQIHIEQYKELLFLGFFLIYAYDFIKSILSGNSWETAYNDIRLEKEAYAHESDLDYLESRRRYNWFKR